MLTIATFYKFVSIDNCSELQASVRDYCEQHQILGTILLATEGINGSIAGTAEAITAALAYLRQDPRLSDLSHQEAICQGKPPFSKLKVKVKSEIVTFRSDQADPTQQVGTYVAPQDWNALISDPAVILIDTRNDYEVEVGTFAGAIDPQTSSFNELPTYVSQNLDPQKNPKVAMFCTGGIRCEKATAWMLAAGFKEVYHLEGGIINYLKQIPVTESKWQGECFVFDRRVAVTHGLEPGTHLMCYDCGFPMPQERLTADCPHCGAVS
jgi:UPF0176 protein